MQNILTKTIDQVKHFWYEIFITICMILALFIGYNIGHITALEKSPISIGTDAAILDALKKAGDSSGLFQAEDRNVSTTSLQDLRVVVSKKSKSKKYHFTWCSGAKRINEVNKLWFENEVAAQAAGYTLAGNCK